MTDTKREIERKMRENFDSLKRDEFMSLSEYLVSPIAVRDLQKKAFGGRIGFKDGKLADKIIDIPTPGELEIYTEYFMREQGLPRAEAESKAEKFLYGPDSQAQLRDLNRGLGSIRMAAGDDDDDYKAHPFIDDPEGRMDTDEFEAIRQILESGRLTRAGDDDDDYKSPPFIDDPEGRLETDELDAIRQILESGQLTQLDDDELFRMYDSMLESEAGSRLLDEYNINSFEEYKDFINRVKRRPEGIENIMPIMVA